MRRPAAASVETAVSTLIGIRAAMSIKEKFARSSGWVILGTGADNLIQFIMFAILARMLSVADLGVVAFAIVLIDFGRIFAYGGLPETMVQRREWDDRIASICFTANLGSATILALLLAFVGGPIMSAYYLPGSGTVLGVLSLMFVIDASRAVHVAKLRREFRYKNLAVRGTVAGLIAGGGAILMAVNGFGIWSLVFQRLATALTQTVLTWMAARWTPRLTFDLAVLKELAPFSSRVTIARFLEVMNMRVADLVVGFMLGPPAVAVYRVGARGLEAINRLAIRPFQDAAFSAFSRVGEAAEIGSAFVRVTRTAALFTFPIFFGAAVTAPEFTVLMFGEKYAQSGGIMAVLALGSIPATITLFTAAAVMAAGSAKAVLRSNMVAAGSNLLLSAVLTPFGTLGAAVGSSISQFVITPYNLWLMRHALMVPGSLVLRAILPPLLAGGTMAGLLWSIKIFLLQGLSPALTILVLMSVGGVVYPAVLLVRGRRYLVDMAAELRPLLPARIAGWLAPGTVERS